MGGGGVRGRVRSSPGVRGRSPTGVSGRTLKCRKSGRPASEEGGVGPPEGPGSVLSRGGGDLEENSDNLSVRSSPLSMKRCVTL